MIPARLQQFPCVICAEKHPPVQRLGISVPALVVPIIDYPIPLYLRFRGALCHAHTAAFNVNTFTDYYGAWYDMVSDHLRSLTKPAVNPYPDDSNFKWEAFKLKPNWEAVPKDECYVQFWEPNSLAAKGARASLW